MQYGGSIVSGENGALIRTRAANERRAQGVEDEQETQLINTSYPFVTRSLSRLSLGRRTPFVQRQLQGPSYAVRPHVSISKEQTSLQHTNDAPITTSATLS